MYEIMKEEPIHNTHENQKSKNQACPTGGHPGGNQAFHQAPK